MSFIDADCTWIGEIDPGDTSWLSCAHVESHSTNPDAERIFQAPDKSGAVGIAASGCHEYQGLREQVLAGDDGE
jgi:hypothetical protein